MNFTIRNTAAEDYSTLRSLAFQCEPLDRHTPYTYWVCCNYFSEWCFLLEHESTPIGYIMAICTDDLVFIWQIGILPVFQKRKLSSLLIGAVTTKMRVENYCKFQATIDLSNRNSIKAFESFAKVNGFSMRKINTINVIDKQEKKLTDDYEAVFEFVSDTHSLGPA